MKKKVYIQPVLETTDMSTRAIMQSAGTSTVINNEMTTIGGEGVD